MKGKYIYKTINCILSKITLALVSLLVLAISAISVALAVFKYDKVEKWVIIGVIFVSIILIIIYYNKTRFHFKEIINNTFEKINEHDKINHEEIVCKNITILNNNIAALNKNIETLNRQMITIKKRINKLNRRLANKRRY